MVCTICLIISLYIRYDIWLQWSKTIERYTKYDNFINTGLWKNLLIEVIINLISPYPYFDGKMYTEEMSDFGITIK